MSFWTHIVGVLHVDTFKEVDDIKTFVEESLKDAPKITGSESDAAIFVNPEPGYCTSTDMDCRRCEYGKSLRHDKDGYLYCDGPEGYQCPYGEYQSRAVITVQGDLRDRMRNQTRKEWNAFHRYIAKKLGYSVRIATCRIEGW